LKQRGLTIVTVLILLAGIGGVYWIVTYGPAYWDNVDVNHILKQAANMCYREPNDAAVTSWVFIELHRRFDEDVQQNGRVERAMSIDADPQDLRIERSEQPKYVHIWLTYHRNINLPLIGGQRELTFVDHAEQDLSPVKW
jgi:hypothetical protein